MGLDLPSVTPGRTHGRNDLFFFSPHGKLSFFASGVGVLKHRVQSCAHVSRQCAAHTRTRASTVVFTTDKIHKKAFASIIMCVGH